MSRSFWWAISILLLVLVAAGLYNGLGFEHKRKSKYEHE